MGLNLDWAGDINNAWKDHQKKKDKDHEAKLLNELKNANIQYADNNGKKVWYIMKLSKGIILVPNRGAVGTTSSIFGGRFALRNAQDIGSTIIGASLLTEQLLSIQVSKTKKQADFEKAIEEGKPSKNHKTQPFSKDKNGLESEGDPNSSQDLLNPDGSVKQRRYYDKNGDILEDIDYNHTDNGTHTFPHRHK
ncbi:hypothetical protein ACWOFR_10960 [Carnobacterium gallinarum]|uniref:hypothetical protein n=1 Tax=Carnobacterium gallinarum TaxID=2749 RepID=UPI00055376D9|nr:hypothetical protein [Carnobacterium gallinarum]